MFDAPMLHVMTKATMSRAPSKNMMMAACLIGDASSDPRGLVIFDRDYRAQCTAQPRGWVA